MFMQKFHQANSAKSSGSWDIIVTEKQRNDAVNNTAVATADSNNCVKVHCLH